MTGQQIITIGATGAVSGLQRKPGQGVDLTKIGGAAHVVRASEIVWDADAQAWKIDVLQEHGKGEVTLRRFEMAVYPNTSDGFGRATIAKLEALGVAWGCKDSDGKFDHELADFGVDWNDPRGVILFDTYDDAVKVEVAFLDALRVRGAC